MLSEKEIALVTHLSNAGKGIIAITEIISLRRMNEYEYGKLLIDVAECVNYKVRKEVYIK